MCFILSFRYAYPSLTSKLFDQFGNFVRIRIVTLVSPVTCFIVNRFVVGIIVYLFYHLDIVQCSIFVEVTCVTYFIIWWLIFDQIGGCLEFFFCIKVFFDMVTLVSLVAYLINSHTWRLKYIYFRSPWPAVMKPNGYTNTRIFLI